MAHVDLKVPIDPSGEGLESIYRRCYDEWSHFKIDHPWGYLQLAVGLPHIESSYSVSQRATSECILLDMILRKASALFIGDNRKPFKRHNITIIKKPQCTAFVENGVCVWIDALRTLDPEAANIGTTHITPGHIMYKERNYTSVWDIKRASEKLFSLFTKADFQDTSNTSLVTRQEGPRYTIQALVTERSKTDTLDFVYGVQGEKFGRCLQPGILTEEVLAATAQAPCPRTETCSDALSAACLQRRSGWDFGDTPIENSREVAMEPNSSYFLWNVLDPITKFLAIEGCRQSIRPVNGHFRTSVVLMRSEQCLACITRYSRDFNRELQLDRSAYRAAKTFSSQSLNNELLYAIHVI